jgi:hypothetical protein
MPQIKLLIDDTVVYDSNSNSTVYDSNSNSTTTTSANPDIIKEADKSKWLIHADQPEKGYYYYYETKDSNANIIYKRTECYQLI